MHRTYIFGMHFERLAFQGISQLQGQAAFGTIVGIFLANFRVHGTGIGFAGSVFWHCLTPFFYAKQECSTHLHHVPFPLLQHSVRLGLGAKPIIRI